MRVLGAHRVAVTRASFLLGFLVSQMGRPESGAPCSTSCATPSLPRWPRPPSGKFPGGRCSISTRWTLATIFPGKLGPCPGLWIEERGEGPYHSPRSFVTPSKFCLDFYCFYLHVFNQVNNKISNKNKDKQ